MPQGQPGRGGALSQSLTSERFDMGEVHSLLEAKGKQAALLAGLDRDVIEAAAAYMTDEDSSLGFAFSGWAQCALPHRRLASEDRWEIAGEHIRLVIEPGLRPSA